MMAENTTTTVPVKLDASALAAALSKMSANAPVEYIEPAPFISNAGTRMASLYERYMLLNAIAMTLNGKRLSEPLPAELKLEKITLTFSTEKKPEQQSVDVYNVACIGDIAPLLSTEIGAIIYSLEQEAKSVVDIATKTTETCTKARTDWEAANPDRKIVRSDVVGENGTPIPGGPATPQVVVESPKKEALNNENKSV